jgi:hypothetical protein
LYLGRRTFLRDIVRCRSNTVTVVPVQTLPPARRLLSARGVASRYGVHLGSLSRWIASGVIPPPDTYINRVRFWFVESLDAADRRRAAEHAAGKAKTAPVRNQTPPPAT